jgi:preprotein translocase subunit SecE
MNAQVNSSNSMFDLFKWFLVIVLIAAAIGGNYYFSTESLIFRVLGVVLALGLAVVIALATERGRSVNRLRKEAWVEVRKVVWPTRQETVQTTLVVIGFVLVVALILWLVDTLLSMGVSVVIG